jgi:hypothetical protein
VKKGINPSNALAGNRRAVGRAANGPALPLSAGRRHLVTYFPTEWHEQQRIPYVCANLIALKEGMPRNGGRLFI